MSLFNTHLKTRARTANAKVPKVPQDYAQRTAPLIRRTQNQLTEEQVEAAVTRLWTMRNQFGRAALANKRTLR